MVPNFDKIHNRFKLNGKYYNHDTLKEVAFDYIKEGLPYQKEIGDFLFDWLNTSNFITVKTSGSTGKSKLIQLKKQSMVNSAVTTGDYFRLVSGNTALHCLPTKFIAGKMMLVRAMILGLELDTIEPNSHPLAYINKSYNFCAMVPWQLENSISSLSNIETLIVGGAAVSEILQKQLQEINCKVYATYGMTETVTHIAIKKLNNNPDECYEVLSGVNVSIDDRDCLIINAPNLRNELVITNDVVELNSDTTFKLLGRIDNVINSGGMKLFPEQIEQKLSQIMEERFFVTSKADNKLGERLILVVEGNSNKKSLFESIKKDDTLNKYEIPKEIHYIPQFMETDSGKIQRIKTLELLKD